MLLLAREEPAFSPQGGQAREDLDCATALAEHLDDIKLQVRILNNRGVQCLRQGQNDEALRCLLAALPLSQRRTRPAPAAAGPGPHRRGHRTCLLHLRHIGNAIACWQEAATVYDDAGYPREAAEVRRRLHDVQVSPTRSRPS
jgi:tetratricopeptide (TPR) repeat protein